ncbi:hypothetical protein CP02DC14_2174 [Chlamydia psittaci 02DC14]|nr:hypothetical protein CP02DC14_2174 [Chlamydia psittaci 02DC14]
MRCISRTQRSFSERFFPVFNGRYFLFHFSQEIFFPVFNGRYFLFHHSTLRASKYHVANSTRTIFAKGFWRGNL